MKATMFQFPSDAFGALPYPEFPHMLFACFPLLVLIICVHVVSGNSAAPGMLGVGFGAASALLRQAASGLAALSSGGPLGALRALREKPALVLLAAPVASFCSFRVLPLLLRTEATAVSDVCLSGAFAFAPVELDAAAAKGSAAAAVAAFLSAAWQQIELAPLVLHAFYCSSSSAVVWLLVAPLMLFSAALLLQQAQQQQQRRPGVEGGPLGGSSLRFALRLLLLLPVLPGVLLVYFLSLTGFEDVCISGFTPLLFTINFLAFAADPKLDVGVGAEGWGSLASVRWFSSCICFFFFLFEPALYDIYLFAAAAAAAALTVAAARCSWPTALAAAAAGAAAAAASGAAAAAAAPGSSSAAAAANHLLLAGVFRSPAGIFLGAVVAAAAVGIACSYQDLLFLLIAGKRRPQGVWRLLAVVLGFSLCFLGLPFSLKSTPRSFSEFFASSRPALYSILLSQHDVVLGAIAAKLCAFWLPFYFFVPHPRLKNVLAMALATCILVGMASSQWAGIGPGFLGSVICLYFFIRI